MIMASLLFVIALLLTFFGACVLALSQQYHWQKVAGKKQKSPPITGFRVTGWLLLGIALLLCILRDCAGFAALLWPLLIAVSSFTVAMMLSFKPQWLRPITKLKNVSG